MSCCRAACVSDRDLRTYLDGASRREPPLPAFGHDAGDHHGSCDGYIVGGRKRARGLESKGDIQDPYQQ